LTITSNPFTYDVNTRYKIKVEVTFKNRDESRTVTLSVLDDKGVSVIKDVVVSPGKIYVTTLQLTEIYKFLLVTGTDHYERL
jgi:hypothetical protein